MNEAEEAQRETFFISLDYTGQVNGTNQCDNTMQTRRFWYHLLFA